MLSPSFIIFYIIALISCLSLVILFNNREVIKKKYFLTKIKFLNLKLFLKGLLESGLFFSFLIKNSSVIILTIIRIIIKFFKITIPFLIRTFIRLIIFLYKTIVYFIPMFIFIMIPMFIQGILVGCWYIIWYSFLIFIEICEKIFKHDDNIKLFLTIFFFSFNYLLVMLIFNLVLYDIIIITNGVPDEPYIFKIKFNPLDLMEDLKFTAHLCHPKVEPVPVIEIESEKKPSYFEEIASGIAIGLYISLLIELIRKATGF